MRSPRLAIVGNPGSIHVSRWARHFADHGYDVTVVTFYPAAIEESQHLHARSLRPRARSRTGATPARDASARRGISTRERLVGWMPGGIRLVTAMRHRVAGLRTVLREIGPDIVHGHYLSDYGFLAASGGVRPLVTSAWGSDVLRDPRESRITARIVRWVIGESAIITYNADILGQACRELGARPDQMLKVVLGADAVFLDAGRRNPAASRKPVIISHRSLDRTLFNVDVIVQAMPEVLRHVAHAKLLIGHTGRLEPSLRGLAARLGVEPHVEFIGRAADEKELAERFAEAAVYVAVPDSDGSSVTLLEAMASGCYPVLSDIPSNREWVLPDGGAVVPARDPSRLAAALIAGLEDGGRRSAAAERNRAVIVEHGTWDGNMARMDTRYRELLAT